VVKKTRPFLKAQFLDVVDMSGELLMLLQRKRDEAGRLQRSKEEGKRKSRKERNRKVKKINILKIILII